MSRKKKYDLIVDENMIARKGTARMTNYKIGFGFFLLAFFIGSMLFILSYLGESHILRVFLRVFQIGSVIYFIFVVIYLRYKK